MQELSPSLSSFFPLLEEKRNSQEKGKENHLKKNMTIPLIGANHPTMRWRALVVKEQKQPIMQSSNIDKSVVSSAVLPRCSELKPGITIDQNLEKPLNLRSERVFSILIC